MRVLGSALEMVWVGLSGPGVSFVSSLQVAHLGRLWAGPSRFGGLVLSLLGGRREWALEGSELGPKGFLEQQQTC